ncbi:MAG: hypothetical protein H6R02_378 [Burkholderiaceae bacterium]|nr:hypothetical protein [Burkholderiaceae bacterium]
MRKQLSHGKILTVLRDAIEGGEAIDMPDRAFALVSELTEPVANYLGYALTWSIGICSCDGAPSPSSRARPGSGKGEGNTRRASYTGLRCIPVEMAWPHRRH